MKLVVANLPRTGLGNKLFVWANAYVFANQHNLPLLTIGWFHLSKSTLLYKKHGNRIYLGYFKIKLTPILLSRFLFYKLFFKKKYAFNR